MASSWAWAGAGLCITFHPHRPLPRYLAKLSSVGSISEEETCEKLKGLIQRQVQMCKRNLEVMDSVRRGAQLAIEECQYQFRNRRWNCSTLDSLPVFGKVVTQGEGGARGGAGAAVRGVGPPPGDPGRDRHSLGWGMIHSLVAGLFSHVSSKNSTLLQRGHRVRDPGGGWGGGGGPSEEAAVLHAGWAALLRVQRPQPWGCHLVLQRKKSRLRQAPRRVNSRIRIQTWAPDPQPLGTQPLVGKPISFT